MFFGYLRAKLTCTVTTLYMIPVIDIQIVIQNFLAHRSNILSMWIQFSTINCTRTKYVKHSHELDFELPFTSLFCASTKYCVAVLSLSISCFILWPSKVFWHKECVHEGVFTGDDRTCWAVCTVLPWKWSCCCDVWAPKHRRAVAKGTESVIVMHHTNTRYGI